jgi:3'(2'), 5'-bisphosphate nucleotidase
MKKFTKDDFQYFDLINATIATHEIVLKYFRKDLEIDNKSDDSPVTKADLEINFYLNYIIKKSYPNSAIISEENSSKLNEESLNSDYVFIIDPLDGTSAFIKGSPEFSVNIALKISDKLVMGIIYSPIDDVLYHAENHKLFKITKASSEPQIKQISQQKFQQKSKLKVIATRREEELALIRQDLAQKGLDFELVSFSSSLKFCYLAEGLADIYYRMASIKLWDVAAGFAIVEAAGFKILKHDKSSLLQDIFSKNGIKKMQQDVFKIPSFLVKL